MLRTTTKPGRVTSLSRRKARQPNLTALLLVAPFTLIYVLFLVYPSLRVVQLSFTNADLTGVGSYVGLRNYTRLVQDPLFWSSLGHSLYFLALTVVPNTALGLIFALLTLRLHLLRNFVLGAVFLPFVLPVSVVTDTWNWMLDGNFGILNYLLNTSNQWFQDPNLAMPAVAFVTVWWSVGFNMLLFIAGLQAIGRELYEAASLDGAGAWQLFWHITWPSLWPVTSLVLLLQLIAQFKVFDQLYLLTNGGPFDSTIVLLLHAYREGFQQNHGGYAATISLVLLVVILAASALQQRLLRRSGG